MGFAIFVIFCVVLTKAQAASIAKDTKMPTHTNLEEVNHNSSISYGYQRPIMPFNYPKVQNTHIKYNSFEVETNLIKQLQNSKSHINVSKRLVGKTSYNANPIRCYKIERDFQIIVAERNRWRPPERRLTPYNQILTYA